VSILTVAIPTHNRAAILRRTLEALTRIEIPSQHEWQLLVVQNNCSDGTAAVLDEFGLRLPLRVLSEARVGINFARNAAVDAAVEAGRGEFIIFTDDDVIPVPQWLSAYASAFASFPDIDIFGGPIEPSFIESPPSWLRDSMSDVASAYGRLECGGRGEVLSATFYPFGANMAFRLRVLKDSQFDPRLGPRGRSRINGSETELILKLLASGHPGRWVEGARIAHCIQEKQMTTEFLRWYFTGQGASMATDSPPGTTMLWGRPRWLWREAVTAEMRFRLGRIFGRSTTWVRDLKRASIARGRLTRRGMRFT
jgi:GT2 family glycosyltransferase